MAEIIFVDDLPTVIQSTELVDTMVAGANAKASRVAPCLVVATSAELPSDEQVQALVEARLILVGAVKRWADAGSGALQSQTAGPFGQTIDTRQRTGYNLWPSEIADLQAICKSLSSEPSSRMAFSVDTAPRRGSDAHIPWCSVFLGETCSCGSSINGYDGPLWEFGYGLDHI